MCAAIRTKDLGARCATFRFFDIGLRRSRQEREVFFLGDNPDAEGAAGEFLTIRTVTNARALWVDCRFIADGAAMATAVNFHVSNLFEWH